MTPQKSLIFALAALAVTACTTTSPSQPPNLCPNSRFTCITLDVPLDHFNPDSPLIPVTFALLRASGERKGFFVTATGGPGTSGIASADSYADGFDPSIPEHFDLVFFDQRGVGLSGSLRCPEAITKFYDTDARPLTLEGETALLDAAQTLARNCVEQLNVRAQRAVPQPPNYLDYLGTRQAVEDLEALRQFMGDDKFWLYGESYGTQFSQAYAAAHPDHLAALILDGTVDLTLSGPDYLREQTQAFNDVLVMTLEACNADPACVADMDGEAVSVYDSLAAALAESPARFRFRADDRVFTFADLEFTAINNLYTPRDRAALLRTLASAKRGDWIPLAELHYDTLGVDADTLEAAPDPSYSDAAYYAVECNDYRHFADAQAYLRAGDEIDSGIPRLTAAFYGDLPCSFWPVSVDSESRPEPLALPYVPTLILAATADPATPYSNSLSVYHRLDDGYLVTMEGGAHVLFGRGDACVDDLVTAFLVEGQTPEQRETTCAGVVIGSYKK